MTHFAYRVDFGGEIKICSALGNGITHTIQSHSQTCVVCGAALPVGSEVVKFIHRHERGKYANKIGYACLAHVVGTIT